MRPLAGDRLTVVSQVQNLVNIVRTEYDFSIRGSCGVRGGGRVHVERREVTYVEGKPAAPRLSTSYILKPAREE